MYADQQFLEIYAANVKQNLIKNLSGVNDSITFAVTTSDFLLKLF